MEPTVTPYDKATETVYPPKDPQHTNYYNGKGGTQSLIQEAPKTPERAAPATPEGKLCYLDFGMMSYVEANQRYAIILKGNHQQLEITSNEELIKENAKFRWRAGVWYRVKSRVDANPDGSGVVRAKVWQRDEPEPEGWLLEVDVPNVTRSGSPGLYGFTPQSRFRVYLDNVTITPNR